MSSEIAISVSRVSKCYSVYAHPRDRLLQMLSMGSKQYSKEYWALQELSFEVKKGDAFGIIGRNGSGKSTLLQIITGTLSPTTGEVQTRGQVAALLELGSGFNPDFTGRENIYLNGALLGIDRSKIDNLYDEIAAFADIGDYLEQPVKTYSSGMLLRVAFAVQVQIKPDILIIDEALAVGDALFQKRCFQKMEQLRNDGVTLLFVSHDQESVRTLTNHALLLSSGRVVAQGTSSEVLLEYRRQLHNAESDYFSKIAESIEEKTVENESDQKPVRDLSTSKDDRLSFGDGGAKIINVTTLDGNGNYAKVFYPNDFLTIRIKVQARTKLEKINVGVRIRNKEGIKIYSWGTLNQDMSTMHQGNRKSIFWNKKFQEDDTIEVDFKFKCSLGVNLYEIQASVTREDTPDYMAQRSLHWVDEAAFFQVLMKRDEYFFGGVVDLEMQADWKTV